MRRLSIVTLLLAFGLSSTLWAAEKPEPRYGGKPLATWVELLQKGETFQAQREAAEALKDFGADCAPAVPELVRMLDDRSDAFRGLVTEVLCNMGPAAKAAVPELVRSLKDKSAREPAAVV